MCVKDASCYFVCFVDRNYEVSTTCGSGWAPRNPPATAGGTDLIAQDDPRITRNTRDNTKRQTEPTARLRYVFATGVV